MKLGVDPEEGHAERDRQAVRNHEEQVRTRERKMQRLLLKRHVGAAVFHDQLCKKEMIVLALKITQIPAHTAMIATTEIRIDSMTMPAQIIARVPIVVSTLD
jgi:predicted secreted Zn-dependent protease